MSDSNTEPDANAARRFRVNLVRVMAVQLVTLVVLWLLQRHFSI